MFSLLPSAFLLGETSLPELVASYFLPYTTARHYLVHLLFISLLSMVPHGTEQILEGHLLNEGNPPHLSCQVGIVGVVFGSMNRNVA